MKTFEDVEEVVNFLTDYHKKVIDTDFQYKSNVYHTKGNVIPTGVYEKLISLYFDIHEPRIRQQYINQKI